MQWLAASTRRAWLLIFLLVGQGYAQSDDDRPFTEDIVASTRQLAWALKHCEMLSYNIPNGQAACDSVEAKRQALAALGWNPEVALDRFHRGCAVVRDTFREAALGRDTGRRADTTLAALQEAYADSTPGIDAESLREIVSSVYGNTPMAEMSPEQLASGAHDLCRYGGPDIHEVWEAELGIRP